MANNSAAQHNHTAVDGLLFQRMARGGLASLRHAEKEVNRLNVFPVPDGDTGTNMCRTVELGVKSAHQDPNLGRYLKELGAGMLLGARGNSGVILSQVFKGICDSLAELESASTADLARAFIQGYQTAYASVVHPVEGTILTVTREGIEGAWGALDPSADVETLLETYIAQMHAVLLTTPDLLPVLKDAGVVDSGGYGYIKIIEGMLQALRGEEIAVPEEGGGDQTPVIDLNSFGTRSDFRFGYCMEFLLQLMESKAPVDRFDVDQYIAALQRHGESLVVIQNEYRVKVHIHTFRPESVISLSRQYGEFLTFKLENMHLQHNEYVADRKKERPHRPLAVLAVADGAGFQSIFAEQGCDLVLEGGRTMNTSVQDFLEAYEELNADTVAVLPNDKNIRAAARQAAELFTKGQVIILPTEDMVQGYFALASDIGTDPPDQRLAEMEEGAQGNFTVFVSRASKDWSSGGVSCQAGDYVAGWDDDILLSDPDLISATLRVLEQVPDFADKEQLIVFTGRDLPAGLDLEDRLSAALPQLQVDFMEGGQAMAELIIGII